ncbi:glycosyltransferase [Polaromonas sp. A23]|uniref:glycosyltransferase n=1 Tax=Polaromonas sp. A23 TaxID=1944133 RepID=UPI000985BB03|nr:glycosyltransferase [Polaromonas sp. A23]OOG48392.1 hypothetical protein B0B52_00140 [Polaromonas sp. A23]
MIRRLLRALPRAVSFYDGSLWRTVWRALVLLRRHGWRGVLLRARLLNVLPPPRQELDIAPSDLFHCQEVPWPGGAPKVSVIVPCFNHAAYLPDRLDSIFAQGYPNLEVILLDDASTDGSQAILQRYAQRPEVTHCVLNTGNSGSAFRQWRRGLQLATGDLVWIAESDDYCDNNFLQEVLRCFSNPAVRLAFARTTFVRGTPPVEIWSSEEYLGDLGLGLWSRPFTMAAHSLVKLAWSRKNILPNVSAAVFRHPGQCSLLEDPQWQSLRACGDWLLYLHLVRGGLVGYTPKATNFYRQHEGNTSVSFQAQPEYYREHALVAQHMVQLYRLEDADLQPLRAQLLRQWRQHHPLAPEHELDGLFALAPILVHGARRQPNVLMALFAFAAGGGETFPIQLANLLYSRGYAITLLDCQLAETEPGIQAQVHPGIAILRLDKPYLIGRALRDMGIELVHSHHASVDMMMHNLLSMYPEIVRIISLHGMYELMSTAQQRTTLRRLDGKVDAFVYTAEKNLQAFTPDFQARHRFTRIDNALERRPFHPTCRSALGISDADFVFCMVARAIPEKGWEEAIAATQLANTRSHRRIHLLLIGEGPELSRLRPQHVLDTCVHFVGFQAHVRDYFAMADMGLLPSRFRGESAPLVLIDCLFSGRPLLASDIGEIRTMLAGPQGLAGELFALTDWTIPVAVLSDHMLELANDLSRYAALRNRVDAAAAKFDPDRMAERYEQVYAESLQGRRIASP